MNGVVFFENVATIERYRMLEAADRQPLLTVWSMDRLSVRPTASHGCWQHIQQFAQWTVHQFYRLGWRVGDQATLDRVRTQAEDFLAGRKSLGRELQRIEEKYGLRPPQSEESQEVGASSSEVPRQRVHVRQPGDIEAAMGRIMGHLGRVDGQVAKKMQERESLGQQLVELNQQYIALHALQDLGLSVTSMTHREMSTLARDYDAQMSGFHGAMEEMREISRPWTQEGGARSSPESSEDWDDLPSIEGLRQRTAQEETTQKRNPFKELFKELIDVLSGDTSIDTPVSDEHREQIHSGIKNCVAMALADCQSEYASAEVRLQNLLGEIEIMGLEHVFVQEQLRTATAQRDEVCQAGQTALQAMRDFAKETRQERQQHLEALLRGLKEIKDMLEIFQPKEKPADGQVVDPPESFETSCEAISW